MTDSTHGSGEELTELADQLGDLVLSVNVLVSIAETLLAVPARRSHCPRSRPGGTMTEPTSEYRELADEVSETAAKMRRIGSFYVSSEWLERIAAALEGVAWFEEWLNEARTVEEKGVPTWWGRGVDCWRPGQIWLYVGADPIGKGCTLSEAIENARAK